MGRIRPLLAVLCALAIFTAACGDDDDTAADDVSAESDDTTDTDGGAADDGADDSGAEEDGGEDEGAAEDDMAAAEQTDEEILTEAGVALPTDFTIATVEKVDGEVWVNGSYSADPQGPVGTMTAAGWTHLGTRDGSFIMDFRQDPMRCAIVYALVAGTFATLVADGDDCAALSNDRASEVKAYAERDAAVTAN